MSYNVTLFIQFGNVMLTLTSPQIQSVIPLTVLDSVQIPLSLYIHVPWCVKKCPYCDFNSHQQRDNIDFTQYVDVLLDDLTNQLIYVNGRKIQSIFVGGGTPSLLPIQQYHQLLSGIKSRIELVDDCEITIEANPATVEHAPFTDYLQVGINRLSLGVQSFHDKQLLELGRIHQSSQAISAIFSARQAGFSRLNVDIMHGLPKQTLNEALVDLQQAIDLGVPHLSWYQLTIEPNTVFYRQPPVLPNDDVLADIFEQGTALLIKHGYQQYEVSAWTRQDNYQPSKHNLNYWQFGDYLAIGAGAHGKVTLADGIYRFSKTRLPKDYFKNNLNIGWQKIAQKDLAFEFMMNALRLKQGVTQDLWQQRTGQAWSVIEPMLQRLEQQGFIDLTNHRIRCSEQGFLFLNQILAEFLS